MSEQSKSALISFILACVGACFAVSWLGGIVAVPLGIVSLAFSKKNDPETQDQPFMTFGRIAKPVAIVAIIVGAVMFLVALIVTIVGAVATAAAAQA